MSLRVSSNVAAIAATRNIGQSQQRVDRSLKALASGQRIVNAGDDAAGFAIGEMLRGQLSGIRQSEANAENAIGFVQVAEGSLNEQNNILIRLRELAVQSASDTIDEREREFLQLEFGQLIDEFDRIAHTTRYGTNKLLVGEARDFEFQLGANSGKENIVKFRLEADTTANHLGLTDLAVEDKDEARDSLEVLDELVVQIAGIRANFGAIQSRLSFARDNLQVQEENIAAAHSNIVDADVAEEISKLTSSRVQQDFAISVLSQANQSQRSAIQLLV